MKMRINDTPAASHLAFASEKEGERSAGTRRKRRKKKRTRSHCWNRRRRENRCGNRRRRCGNRRGVGTGGAGAGAGGGDAGAGGSGASSVQGKKTRFRAGLCSGLNALLYCTHYFDCSVTWYSRVATTQQTRVTTTCNSTHSTTPPHSLPPLHSPSPPAHKSPTALCPPTRLTLGAPATSPCNAASSVALGRDTTSLPPVPLLHVVMHATRRPLSCLILGCDTMPPLPLLSFRALSSSFCFSFFFFLYSR